MKAPIFTLLFCSVALCELPPPYLRQDFRPSPQQYKPQSQKVNTIDVKIPSRLTIEQLIKLTEQLQDSQQRVVHRPQKIQVSFGQNLPLSKPAQPTVNFQLQDSYLPPTKQPEDPFRPLVPQNSYLPPSKQPVQNYRPQSQLRPPFSSQPQNGQSFRPQNSQRPISFGPGQNIEQAFTPQNQQSVPQNQFPPIQPQTQRPSYNLPAFPDKSQNQYNQFSPTQSNVQAFRPSQQGSLPAQNQFDSFQTAGPAVRPQTQYGPPQRPSTQGLPEKLQTSQQGFPQATYGVPNSETSGSVNTQQRPPATNYGLPETRPIETLGEQKTDEEILRQNILDELKKQHLPYKPPTGFRPESLNPQYLPSVGESPVGQRPQGSFAGNIPGVSQGGDFNKPSSENTGEANRPNTSSVGQSYLPPRGTAEGGLSSKPTTARPTTAEPSPESVDGLSKPDKKYKPQQPADNPLSQDGSEAGPNISIANAVAGAENFFYLQQPDGRLQKVVLEKTKEPNSKPEEYVANYYFQNIQALPNVLYTPLVTLDYTQQ